MPSQPTIEIGSRAGGSSPPAALATRPRPGGPPPVPGGARHVPEGASEQAPNPNQKRFVLAFLVSCLGVLAVVLAMNIVIDPFAIAGSGIVPTAVESDRSIKLDLLQHLKRGPETLILGSSRSRQAEPQFLRTLTGRAGFNAGVTGGTSADEYVFVRFAAGLFPHQKRRYVWFTDVGLAGGGVLPQLADDPRARKYLVGGSGFGLGDVGTYLSTDATRASFRVFRKCVLATCRSYIRYNPDGSLTNQSLHYLPEHAKSLKKSVAKLIAGVRTHHETLAQARADLAQPGRFFYFERALAVHEQAGRGAGDRAQSRLSHRARPAREVRLRGTPRDAGEGGRAP